MKPAMLFTFLHRLQRHPFIKNTVTLAGGGLLAMLIPLLAMPVLTQLYTPLVFGAYALFMAWLGNAVVLMSGRYDLAILLPKTDHEARHLAVLAWGLGLVISSVLVLILYALAQLPNAHPNLHLMRPWLGWFWFIAVAYNTNQIYVQWSNRQQRYKILSLHRIGIAASLALAQLALGYAQVGLIGLIGGTAVSIVVANLILLSPDKRSISTLKTLTRPTFYAVANRYRQFPLITLPNAFFQSLQEPLSLLIIGAYTDLHTVGLFGLMSRIVKLPVSIIALSMGQVFTKELVLAKQAEQPLWPIVKKMGLALMMLGIAPFLVILFWGEMLFTAVFGTSWAGAGTLAQAFAVYTYGQFVISPLSSLTLVLEKQVQSLYFSLLGNALFLISLALGLLAFHHELAPALTVVSVVMLFYFCTFAVWAIRTVKRHDANYLPSSFEKMNGS
jgi:O-antigen/teichoic acid export membrane protein